MHATDKQPGRHMNEPDLRVIDDELLIEWARIDMDAFEAIYFRYSGPVYRMCLRACGDPDTADDLTSIVFLKAFERLDQYRRQPKGTFRAWLFAIVRNALLDHWRRSKRVTNFAEDAPEVSDGDPGPEEITLSRIELAEVRDILSSLTDRHRSIVEFRLSGLTTREISEALGITISAVKSAQTRAYANIRSRLAHQGAQK